MAEQLPACPECASEYSYSNGELLTCPMCAHEWVPGADGDNSDNFEAPTIRDSVGNVLEDGDTVTIVKGMKVKGASALKSGTKVRGIRLLPNGPDGHDLEARVAGSGQLLLKSSIVKKVT